MTLRSGQAGADLPGLLPATYLPVAAFGLVAAWAVLLHAILWPAAAPVRRYGAMALDLAVISAFLHFGGGEVAPDGPDVHVVEQPTEQQRNPYGLVGEATSVVAGIPKSRMPKLPMEANTGADTIPPKYGVGSSRTTMADSLGASAGTKPTKLAM